jgi:hypothetical protein
MAAMARRTPLLAVLVALAFVLALPAGSASAASCKKLKVTSELKAELRKAHERLTDRAFTGPTKTHYGRCGTRYYALGWMKDAELGYQDQPERFTRLQGGAWKDRGDTGGPPCDTGFPRALLRLWGYDC